MSNQETDLQKFLAQHPDIEMFEVILPDLNGRLRGKWIGRDKIEKVFAGSLKLPLSALAFDIWGRDVEATVFDSGDADGLAVADIKTLKPTPWLKRPTAQVLLSLNETNGEPCAYDGRHLLKSLMAKFQALDLTPVAAFEMEFSLFAQENDEQGVPRHSQSEYRNALQAGDTYRIESMQDMGELMHAIHDACEAQGLPVDTLIKEAAPSQYEINLYHQANALLAADQALMLQRVIKGVAKQFGLRASFMAKPFGDLAGNGMHVHCSLLDTDSNNVFNDGSSEGTELLQQAIAGCLMSMADSMLLFAPHLNSYRRFQRGSHAPMAANWGYENRTVAVRVPADKPVATRIEHRVAGADANPYLVLAAILAGMLYGIEQKLVPPAAISGNAYDQCPPDLPNYWVLARTRFAESEFIKNYLGDAFQHTYSAVKQQEHDEFNRHVTKLEYESYL